MKEINNATGFSPCQDGDLAHALGREAFVLAAGTLGGAAKTAVEHPLETLGETAAMTIAAAGLTALAAAEISVVSPVAVGAGIVYGAGFAWNLIDPNNEHNRERNYALKSAVSTAWTTAEKSKLENSIQDLQEKSGPDTLKVIEALTAGGAAFKYGARAGDVVRSMPGETPLAFANDCAAPKWFQMSSDGKAPAWEDYVNFAKRNGPVRTIKFHQHENILRAESERSLAFPAEGAKPPVSEQTPQTSSQTSLAQATATVSRDGGAPSESAKVAPDNATKSEPPASSNSSHYFNSRYGIFNR